MRSWAAVDAGLDPPTSTLRAERTPDGGLLHTQYPLYLSASVPPITAQRVGSILPLSHLQVFAIKEITSRHTVGITPRHSCQSTARAPAAPSRAAPRAWPVPGASQRSWSVSDADILRLPVLDAPGPLGLPATRSHPRDRSGLGHWYTPVPLQNDRHPCPSTGNRRRYGSCLWPLCD